MAIANKQLVEILPQVFLGDSIAEDDQLLEVTRIETSVFSDLLYDRVDLIPGTKGSGKSALYRIFVEFLPNVLLSQRKVVIAHGVTAHGDQVFHAYKERFAKLSEDDFIDFWCIYFVSLVYEQFIKNPEYAELLKDCAKEINNFRSICASAKIPEIHGRKTLKNVLDWCLNAVGKFAKTDVGYKYGEHEFQATLFGDVKELTSEQPAQHKSELPVYVSELQKSIEKILNKIDLSMWLMVDRLDEIFPRRSELEQKALRGLLRTVRFFTSPRIRIKIFLRDDILSNIVHTKEGFTALSHVTSRQADTLKWDENQLLDLIVKRLVTNEALSSYLEIDQDKFAANAAYRREIFYRIFPPTIHKGEKQSNTSRWIYTRIADGNGVVTPRDLIFLITKAIQKQQFISLNDPNGNSEYIISPQAIIFGYDELSAHKRTTILEAELPHLWVHIEKLIGGKAEYKKDTLKRLFGKSWEGIVEDLVSVGVLSKTRDTYKIPFLYRKGLDVTQGIN